MSIFKHKLSISVDNADELDKTDAIIQCMPHKFSMVRTLHFRLASNAVCLPNQLLRKTSMVVQRSSLLAEPAHDMATLTPRAAEKIAELVKLQDETQIYIRLRAEVRGFDDIRYFIVLDDSVGHSDIKVKTQGVAIFIDNASLKYLAGAQIDYDERAPHPCFVIDSLNEQTFCGHSSAFSTCPR
ncbi:MULTISPECIES: HesB/IscA family protein [Paraburkholderia]|nr:MULTISPECIES: iron-sulfur cluster assembly accessory protein [Paraburkholderia]MCO4882044.1 iron-sulfur cluster assembly accessory protein [Paraburkholderia caribensis]